MRYQDPFDKVIISCSKCRNKLRVPTDRGSILVSCPLCKTNFKYNPNSIIESIKQAILYLPSMLPKDRKRRLIAIVIGFLIILGFLISIFMPIGKKLPKTNNNPDKLVINTMNIIC